MRVCGSDGPGRPIGASVVIDLKAYEGAYVLQLERKRLAEMIAEAILKDDTFFRENSLEGGLKRISLDCVVFTRAELEGFAITQYEKGRLR